jgi:hypothetical protein
MSTMDLTGATIEQLIATYRNAAASKDAAREAGDYRNGNVHARILADVYRELRRRGQAAQEALLPLLNDHQIGVTAWAGAHALELRQPKPYLS